MIVSDLVEKYEAALAEARLAFVTGPTMRVLLDENVDGKLLEAFLIQYCSLGVATIAPPLKLVDINLSSYYSIVVALLSILAVTVQCK